MKENLKIYEKEQNSINIIEIYPSQSQSNSIIYIKCKSKDDIANITAFTKNLPKTIYDDNPPTIVKHVPKEFYNRYQRLEKTLWQLRKSDLGKIQTNTRLGKTDYIIRYKSKDDTTKWNLITPMIIPANVPQPDIPE